jgi:hypothetical protein
MKRQAILSLFTCMALQITVNAQSCCTTGAVCNYSILPNIDKHIIGTRYTYSQLSNITHSLNPELNGTKNTERVNTLELFGRFNLNKRFQLSVIIPITFVQQYSKIANQKSGGLGDITFMAQYAVIDAAKMITKKTKHQLRIGIGTKLPSGDFGKNEQNLYNTSIQPGTGSIDFIGNALYSFRYKKFGFNARAAYKLNTPNPQTFRYGDKIEDELSFFYVVTKGSLTLMPMAGIVYAHTFNNHNYRQPVYKSQTNLVTATVSLNANIGHITFEISAQPVLLSKVNAMAYNQQIAANAGLFYTF